MKFYSEVLNEMFDSAEELMAEEARVEAAKEAEAAEKAKREEERAKHITDIEAAYDMLVEARKQFNELQAAYKKEYGTSHTVIRKTSGEVFPTSLESLINDIHFFDHFFKS